ncbi:MAG TPA: glycoside hydrolase family 127 protein [Chloroflexia bacterium]|jgi:hypothetical protein
MHPLGTDAPLKKGYPVEPVPFTAVRCEDEFWKSRIETNRAISIPFAFEQCEQTGRIDNFRRAAEVLKNSPGADRTPPALVWDDSDVFKVIEGAAYTLSSHPDPALEAYLDGLIELIAAAQEPDGYLYTARTINPENTPDFAGSTRWEFERQSSHELYNLGHLYEAAVAHLHATGKRDLLDVALKSADLLDRTFGPDKESIWPGHEVTEMALVKLYRVTGEERYLVLAKFLLDERGRDEHEGSGREYNQSHAPVVEQSEAVGHAVRATYLYAGMAEVAAATVGTGYIEALDRIWEDVVGRKLYITGGIGATAQGEAFGPAYDLPNLTAYSETCAAIGNVFWSHRLFLLHADARYIDVLERTLYNALLSGISLDGTAFFYENPLASDGTHQRSLWFDCACCPSNVARFLPALPGYVYARQDDTIYVNLFVAGTAVIELGPGRVVKLEQETRYPWDGKVRLTVSPDVAGPFAIKVRIPGWARNEVVPSDLYRFVDGIEETATLTVNGEPIDLQVDRGYATLMRVWQPGDVIELDLPMPLRRVVAHERVEANRGRVALQRGPLVYCAEWPDNHGGAVRDLLLPDGGTFATEWVPDLLNGVVVLKGRALRQTKGEGGEAASAEQDFTAIPYYAWAHRGPGEMLVWLPTTTGTEHRG